LLSSEAAYNFVCMPKEKTKERVFAENLFVEQLMTCEQIHEQYGYSTNTLSKWRNKYEWDKQREDTINNPLKMRRIIAQQMLKVVQGEETTIDADALSKLFKVYEGISEKINPGICAAVMKIYDEYLAKENPALASQNLPYNKKFIAHSINVYG
jgi:transposase-like protein